MKDLPCRLEFSSQFLATLVKLDILLLLHPLLQRTLQLSELDLCLTLLSLIVSLLGRAYPLYQILARKRLIGKRIQRQLVTAEE